MGVGGRTPGQTGAVGFFERNRQNLVEKGIDPARLPPGQYVTDRFPVLHVGDVPEYDEGQWDLSVFGLVDQPFSLTFDELVALPSVTSRGDSRIVPLLKAGAGVVTTRAHVQWVVTEHGATDLSVLSDAERPEALVALAHPDFRDELRATLK